MCGKSFWKGAVTFSLTFGLSVFVSVLFISKESGTIENIAVTPNSVPAVNNCVPVDKNLKYETLPLVEPDFESVKKVKPAERPRSSDRKNQIKELEKKTEKMAEPQLYDSSKDSAEYQTLLHKEQCFAAQEQK
ncbi:MAG TPA: hypothetical protein VNB22_06060 [Pyrinomonadaceae bacterium]|jgi:hypothetical protein|nr:hypothetical protein [Pyrinomonadaceae bacterium]